MFASNHAWDRLEDRFGIICKTKRHATIWIKQQLGWRQRKIINSGFAPVGRASAKFGLKDGGQVIVSNRVFKTIITKKQARSINK